MGLKMPNSAGKYLGFRFPNVGRVSPMSWEQHWGRITSVNAGESLIFPMSQCWGHSYAVPHARERRPGAGRMDRGDERD